MSWVDIIGRDPVPWLLDPGNPSARFLTLKHIFRKPTASLQEEQARILTWAPVAMLRRHWVPINFWGRAASPYYGGPIGNFGTLFLLTQLGTPRISETDAVCENLLERGRMPDGSFAPGDKTAAPWLAYTGIALQILAAQPTFQKLAHNRLKDRSIFDASPIVSGGKLILRSNHNLYCFSR